MVGTMQFCEAQPVQAQLSPTIEKSLSGIINNEGFVKQNTFRRSISTNGGNYLGDLFEVDIEGETAKGQKEVNLFIKKIIPLENSDLISVSEVHLREVKLYQQIFPLYAELSKKANIPKEEQFKQIKFYDANSEALIFDNLAKKGFKTMGRRDTISLDYAEKGVSQMAKFHALSFAAEANYPDYFKKNIESIHHFVESKVEGIKKFAENAFELSCTLLEGELRQKLEATKSSLIQKYFELLNTSRRVLCHGDYRINNILHREINGKVAELIPIDYQIIYYGNPVNDFMYFLIPSSDKLLRDNLLYLKDFYYKELSRNLEFFSIKVENVYPRQEFEAEFKERYTFGLITSMHLLPFLFPNEDALPGLEQDLATKKFVVEDSAKDRIRGIVEDFVIWGVL